MKRSPSTFPLFGTYFSLSFRTRRMVIWQHRFDREYLRLYVRTSISFEVSYAENGRHFLLLNVWLHRGGDSYTRAPFTSLVIHSPRGTRRTTYWRVHVGMYVFIVEPEPGATVRAALRHSIVPRALGWTLFTGASTIETRNRGSPSATGDSIKKLTQAAPVP